MTMQLHLRCTCRGYRAPLDNGPTTSGAGGPSSKSLSDHWWGHVLSLETFPALDGWL